MEVLSHNGKDYLTDDRGFLTAYGQWDEGFAEGMAPRVRIADGLTDAHWRVIRFIRREFEESGECPLVFSTCKANGLSTKQFRELFPTGYMRGACKLAGITYRDRLVDYYGEDAARPSAITDVREAIAKSRNKIYRVDVFGFLVDPTEWDEEYAAHKAREMKLPCALSDKHHEVIQYLRRSFTKSGVVPTVFECCEALGIELDDLERLFPDGYDRGAVKLAGLCVK